MCTFYVHHSHLRILISRTSVGLLFLLSSSKKNFHRISSSKEDLLVNKFRKTSTTTSTMTKHRIFVFALCICLVVNNGFVAASQDSIADDDDDTVKIDEDSMPPLASDENAQSSKTEPQDFVTPDPQGNYFFADGFKDQSGIGKTWFLSQAKKDGVDENIAKYNGEWEIGQPERTVLKNDFGLIVKTKARHHAIAAKLNKPFEFGSKPLVVQYDILFQNGQECGGAYVKLLSHTKGFDPKSFQDKTPYTIMFGPDKCGLQSKYHFIIRYKNPKNGSINEHHAKQADKSIDEYFGDKKSHLFTLLLNPDGSYRTFVDQKEAARGNLLENLDPAIVPAKEIEDPSDKKPEDWDEREKIADPDSSKPDDWDETAPETIDDESAKKPDDWLEEEEKFIPDGTAVKPDDWDEEMDGKFEGKLIENPKCAGLSGCGKWTVPKIKNPAYKGKWRAPMITNPNYKGKWKPQMIENPDYFEDASPFSSLEPIGAIGLELWTMSDGIIFDNFLITDDKAVADSYAAATWGAKLAAESRMAEKSSFLNGLVESANEKPWLWAVYLLVILIPIVLITVFCCSGSSSKDDDVAKAKKFDVPNPDDVGEEDEEEEEAPSAVTGTDSPSRRSPEKTKNSVSQADLEEDDEEEVDVEGNVSGEEDEQEEEQEESKPAAKSTSPRQRRARKAE